VDDRLGRPPVDREVEEEIAFHLEMRVRELVAGGMDEDAARAEARRRLGDVERVKARMRHEGKRRDGRMGRRRWLDEIAQDLAFGFRQMRRGPSFAAVAILTLALAIGANAAVFSVVNAVLLRPLPYERPDELVMLWTRYLPPSGFDIPKFPLSGPEFLDVQESTRSFRSVGAFQSGGSRALTSEGRDAERVSVAFVSDDVLPLLGVRPALGRWFTPEEDVPDGPDVTVLSHDLWASRYGADSTLVGRTILMNGVPTEVVGVAPRGFDFPSGAKAWLPLGLDRSDQGGRGAHGILGVGRLAEGKTMADADAELEVVKARWAAEYEHNVAHFVWAEGMEHAVLGDAPRTLFVLLSAVGLVLLVACANVANLLLARAERRRGEVAMRTALGASRGRITRQLLTESLLLAGVAAALGLGLARVGTAAMIALAPTALPRLEGVGIDRTVVLFTGGVALLTAIMFGLAPGLLAGRRVSAGMAAAGRAGHGRAGGVLRRALVTGEVAVSLVVVLMAGLLVRSWVALDRTDRGMDTANLLTFAITLPTADYPDDARTWEEFDGLLARIGAVAGVSGVTAATTLPFADGFSRWDFQLDDRPPRQDGDRAWNAGLSFVGPGLFETLGIPLLAGRGIERDDDADAPLVGVISETMASTYWPGEDPLGKRWGYEQGEESVRWIRVVGVARDPVLTRLDEEPYPFVWIPAAQSGEAVHYHPRTMRIAVRTGSAPEGLVPGVRQAVRDFDPDLPLYAVRTMEDAVSGTLARPRLTTNLLGVFALLALLLAAVGIYGVVSYSVAGRTREIGIRVALGARSGAVVRMILAEGARPVVLGAVIGLGGAWFATRLVKALLYQVAPRDPLTFLLLPVALLGIGMGASWLPARRATRIPPARALREE